MKIVSLTPGQSLGEWPVTLDAATVSAYLEAVDDSTPFYKEAKVAPSMAAVAVAVGALLKALGLPPGTIHAGQELSFMHTLSWNEPITVRAKVAQSAQRGSWHFLTVEMSVNSAGSQEAIRGKSSLLIPLEAKK